MKVKELRSYLRGLPGGMEVAISNECVYEPRDFAIGVHDGRLVLWRQSPTDEIKIEEEEQS